ncbi:hypothetical protein [Phytohabitans kaempferiae]|uniref:Uncharacterized protein n=1 Tax=Phytohabitans kaempferiae TaxID=1620943 RepID=A0ABV6M9J2_9ACTN
MHASDWLALAAIVVAVISAMFSFAQARSSRIQAHASLEAIKLSAKSLAIERRRFHQEMKLSAEALAIERRRLRQESIPKIEMVASETSRRSARITLRFGGPVDYLRNVSYSLLQPTLWEIVEGARVDNMSIGHTHSLCLSHPRVGLRNAARAWRGDAGPMWLRALLWYTAPSMIVLDALEINTRAAGSSLLIDFILKIDADTPDGSITVALPISQRPEK